jgi:hypothetical protein
MDCPPIFQLNIKTQVRKRTHKELGSPSRRIFDAPTENGGRSALNLWCVRARSMLIRGRYSTFSDCLSLQPASGVSAICHGRTG